MEVDLQNLEVLQLHHHPEFLKQSVDLINDEWPRGEGARLNSLQASCDKLPTSLILVKERKFVLGHAKLTPIPSIPESCFVETVVICQHMRGKKLGSLLMRHAEDHCRNVLNLKMIHLSTKGQENFYKKLGYEVCEPISIYGCALNRNSKLATMNTKSETPVQYNQHSRPVTHGIAPPPPPPMPEPSSLPNIKSTKTYMFKYL